VTPFVKVLVGDRSCNGGDHRWSLPVQNEDGKWTPGEWHEHVGPLAILTAGFHLTRNPAFWWKEGAEAYAVEYEGALRDANGELVVHLGNSICCRRVRLTRRLTDSRLETYNIYRSGWHCLSGQIVAVAEGEAVVLAEDRVRVRAYGSAHVEAWGHAIVEARGDVTVSAHENSLIHSLSNQMVRASGCALVFAHNSAQVQAFDKVRVCAFQNASVEVHDEARVIRHPTQAI